MSGGKDGQTLFYKILPATAMGLTSKTTVMAFKSQRYRIQCWSHQELLHHTQHAKNQLNSFSRFQGLMN